MTRINKAVATYFYAVVTGFFCGCGNVVPIETAEKFEWILHFFINLSSGKLNKNVCLSLRPLL